MKAQRSWFIASAGAVVILAALQLFRSHRYLATSPDGRIQFVAIELESGSSFSTALGSKAEAWARDLLFDIGFRKVRRMSLKMTSPPNSHQFVLECRVISARRMHIPFGRLIQRRDTFG
jgi:hypothetical protein